MDEAGLCDRIALIQSGQILSINTPEQIISDYPFTLFAIKADDNYALLEQLRTQDNVRSCYISGEYTHAIFNDKNETIDFDFVEKKKIQPTMEDCFIQLMEKP